MDEIAKTNYLTDYPTQKLYSQATWSFWDIISFFEEDEELFLLNCREISNYGFSYENHRQYFEIIERFSKNKNMKKRGRKECEQFDVVSKNGNYISW